MRYWIAILAVMTAQLAAYSNPQPGESAQLEYARRVEVNIYLPEYEVYSYDTSTVDTIDASVIAGAEQPEVGLKLDFTNSTVQGAFGQGTRLRKIDYFDARDINSFLVKWNPQSAEVHPGFVRNDSRDKYFAEFGISLPVAKRMIGTREQAVERALHLLSTNGYDKISYNDGEIRAYKIEVSKELVDLGPGLEHPELIGLELLRRSEVDTRNMELILLEFSSEASLDAEQAHPLAAKVNAQRRGHWKVRTPKGEGKMFIFVSEELR